MPYDKFGARQIADHGQRIARIETYDAPLMGDWTSYGGTSTIVGWSSFTNQTIFYKQIDDIVFVLFNLQGTSDSTSTNFTIPISAGSQGAVFWMRSLDSGSPVVGLGILSGSGSTVNLYTTYALAGWTASGNKVCTGQFFYLA